MGVKYAVRIVYHLVKTPLYAAPIHFGYDEVYGFFVLYIVKIKRAAEDASECRCPAIAISAIPTRGTVMFARMLGSASRSISLSMGFKAMYNY